MIFNDYFISEVNLYSSWVYSTFSPGWAGREVTSEATGNWITTNFHCGRHGLQLRQLILRQSNRISLRSLACKLEFGIRLQGESTFWILTRGELDSPDTIITKIRKEQSSSRVFIIFGGSVGPNREFKFFRKQEIPNLESNSSIPDN